jgi:DNA-binding response OmpR family regulator
VVVEDGLISNLVRAVLAKRGYEVMVAEASAAAAFLRRPGCQAILVTNAPADFLEFSGTVPLVYVTSLPDPRWQVAFRACRVVPKPFSPQGLRDAVAALRGAP